MPKTSTKRAHGSRPAVDAGLPVKLVDALIAGLGVDETEITRDSRIADDLGADSLDFVELVMDLEGAYGIDIDDADAEKWTTVGDVERYIRAHVKDVA